MEYLKNYLAYFIKLRPYRIFSVIYDVYVVYLLFVNCFENTESNVVLGKMTEIFAGYSHFYSIHL